MPFKHLLIFLLIFTCIFPAGLAPAQDKDKKDACISELKSKVFTKGNFTDAELLEFMKLQSNLTLHKLAWAHMNYRLNKGETTWEKGKSDFKIQKSLLGIIEDNIDKDFKKINDDETLKKAKTDFDNASKKLYGTTHRKSLNTLAPLLQKAIEAQLENSTLSNKAPYLINSSDMMMIGLMAKGESNKSQFYNKGKSNYLTTINSSYLSKHNNPTFDIKTQKDFLSRHISKLNKKIEDKLKKLINPLLMEEVPEICFKNSTRPTCDPKTSDLILSLDELGKALGDYTQGKAAGDADFKAALIKRLDLCNNFLKIAGKCPDQGYVTTECEDCPYTCETGPSVTPSIDPQPLVVPGEPPEKTCKEGLVPFSTTPLICCKEDELLNNEGKCVEEKECKENCSQSINYNHYSTINFFQYSQNKISLEFMQKGSEVRLPPGAWVSLMPSQPSSSPVHFLTLDQRGGAAGGFSQNAEFKIQLPDGSLKSITYEEFQSLINGGQLTPAEGSGAGNGGPGTGPGTEPGTGPGDDPSTISPTALYSLELKQEEGAMKGRKGDLITPIITRGKKEYKRLIIKWTIEAKKDSTIAPFKSDTHIPMFSESTYRLMERNARYEDDPYQIVGKLYGINDDDSEEALSAQAVDIKDQRLKNEALGVQCLAQWSFCNIPDERVSFGQPMILHGNDANYLPWLPW